MIESQQFTYRDLTKNDPISHQKSDFATFIHLARCDSQISIPQLALMLQVHPSIVSRMEEGDVWGTIHSIPLETLEHILHLQKNTLKTLLRSTLLIK